MKSRILRNVPVEEVKELIRELLAAGVSYDRVIEEVAAFLDELIDWKKIVGDLAGAVIEAVDRPLIVAIVKAIVAAVQRQA